MALTYGELHLEFADDGQLAAKELEHFHHLVRLFYNLASLSASAEIPDDPFLIEQQIRNGVADMTKETFDQALGEPSMPGAELVIERISKSSPMLIILSGAAAWLAFAVPFCGGILEIKLPRATINASFKKTFPQALEDLKRVFTSVKKQESHKTVVAATTSHAKWQDVPR